MNEGFNRLLKYDFSGLGCWLTIIAFVLIASSVGLGWIVNGFVILIFLSLLAPIVIWGVAKWWLKSNFVQAQCPVCEYEFTGFKNTEFQCPSCNEPLQICEGRFSRITPPGTIDVDAVEVSVQQIENLEN